MIKTSMKDVSSIFYIESQGNESSRHNYYINSIYFSQLLLDSSDFRIKRFLETVINSSLRCCLNYSPDGLVFDRYSPSTERALGRLTDWWTRDWWTTVVPCTVRSVLRITATRCIEIEEQKRTREDKRGEEREVRRFSSPSRTSKLTRSLERHTEVKVVGCSSSWLRTPQRRRCIDPSVGGSSMYKKTNHRVTTVVRQNARPLRIILFLPLVVIEDLFYNSL